MEKILNDYIDFIRTFENLLKLKYNTNKNPCFVVGKLFERKGSINGIDYWFHGSGCTAEKDGVIYAYDIDVSDNEDVEIVFSLWKFSEFLRTHPKYSLLKYSSQDIENELAKLIDKGILSWLVIMGRVYKTYRFIR